MKTSPDGSLVRHWLLEVRSWCVKRVLPRSPKLSLVQWSLGLIHPCQHGRGFGILFSSLYCITLHHSTLLSAESTCRAHCSSIFSLASTHCFYTPLQHLHCLHSLMIILSHSPSNTQMTDFNGPFDSVPFCPFHRSYLTKYVPNLDLKYSIN